MSQLIETSYLSGRTVYAVLHFGGQVWNKDSLGWENYNQGNWSHYALPLTEQISSGYYSAVYPVDIAAGTLSTEVVYQQNGATPTLPALPGGDSFLTLMQSQGSNTQTIAGSGSAAINLALSADEIIPAIAQTGTLSSTRMSTDLTQAIANAYNGRIILWTSGTLRGQASGITAYAAAGGILTFNAVTNAPNPGDTFIIV